MRNNRIAVTPFLDVLRQDEHALTHHLVGNQETFLVQELTNQSSLTSRRSAHVEHDTVGPDKLRKHLIKEHR